MAATKIGNFTFAKVIGGKAFNKDTKELLTTIPKPTEFSLDDSLPVEFLKGGENMAKILPFTGEQDVKMSITSALTNFDWLSLKLGCEQITSAQLINMDKILKVESNKVSLGAKAKSVRSVFTVDETANNRDDVRLTKATAETPKANEYKFGTGEITFESGMEGKYVHVYFDEEIETSQSVTSTGKQAKVIEMFVDAILIDADTKKPFVAQVYSPQASLTQTTKIAAKNSGTPDNETLEFDLLYDDIIGGSYKIITREREQ